MSVISKSLLSYYNKNIGNSSKAFNFNRKFTSSPSIIIHNKKPFIVNNIAQNENPFIEKKQYNDGFITKFFLRWFSERMCDELGKSYPTDMNYDKFIEISREVIKKSSPNETQQVVMNVLSATAPEQAKKKFRQWFPPVKWSAEFNAWLTAIGFLWLVGECEVQEAEIEKNDGSIELWKSKVFIKKCRYLENSGCTAMCVNMCKIPTQNFFTNEFGLPVRMTPNFEDLSCEMTFGIQPLSYEEDPASTQPCFKNQCPIAIKDITKKCPKTP